MRMRRVVGLAGRPRSPRLQALEPMGWLRIAMSVLLVSCGSAPASPTSAPVEDDAGCPDAFEPDGAAEMTLIVLDADGMSHPLENGGDLPLLFPPQGGRVGFVGVSTRNVDPCGVVLRGALRDPASRQVRLDGRSLNLVPRPDGSYASVDGDLASFANIPLCPNQWAHGDVQDQPFELTVSLTDRFNHVHTQTMTVTPRCAEPDREVQCRCLCAGSYVLGEDCGSETPETPLEPNPSPPRATSIATLPAPLSADRP